MRGSGKTGVGKALLDVQGLQLPNYAQHGTTTARVPLAGVEQLDELYDALLSYGFSDEHVKQALQASIPHERCSKSGTERSLWHTLLQAS